MNYLRLSYLIVMSLLWACQSRELTPFGAKVEIVARETLTDECDYLGKIKKNEWIGGCAGASCVPLKKINKDAKIWLQNAGAELGAEKLVITQYKRNPNNKNEYILEAYGFDCPDK